MKTVTALVLSFLLCSIQLVIADEESDAFASFQQSAQAADLNRAYEAFKRDHPSPVLKEDLANFEKSLAVGAIKIFDQSIEFQSRFPNSSHLPAIRSSVLEQLYTVFGGLLPVPDRRAADVESYVKKLAVDAPQDSRPYTVLVSLAGQLPQARRIAVLDELSHEQTPEPARSEAKDALRTFQRLGKPFDLKFTALDGRNVNLSDLQGKVVLIDFWATSCGPCVREMPDLKKLYSKHKAQGFEVIGITFEPDEEVLSTFLRKQEIPWPQYFDAAGSASPLAKEFAVRRIPVIWLVDRHGVLRYLDGEEDRDRKIEELLREH